MDQVSTATQTHGRVSSSIPRIYYVHPRLAGPLDGWGVLLRHVAAMGFTHVLSAPLFAGISVMVPDDFDVPSPVLGWSGDATSALARYAALAKEHGLAPLLDVIPDRVGVGGAIARSHPALFRTREDGWTLDPRGFAADADAATADGTAHEALAAFWAERFSTWRDAGLDGFRLLALDRLSPETTHALVAAAEGALTFGWTPGLSHDGLRALIGSGLDFVFSSFPWWDFRSDWIWTEAEVLSRVAPAIASVEAPFGPRLAASVHDATLLGRTLARSAKFAAGFGNGWMMPQGFEAATTLSMDPRRDEPSGLDGTDASLLEAIRGANASASVSGVPRLVSAPGGPVVIFHRDGHRVVANVDLVRPRVADGATLPPGDVRVAAYEPAKPVQFVPRPLATSALDAARTSRVAIEAVAPSVENGLFAAKRSAGEVLTVTCDLLCDGHDKLSAALYWRAADEQSWKQTRMRLVDNDRWSASFPLARVGRYEFMIEGWKDEFLSFHDELTKKHAAGVDVRLELIEGRHLVEQANLEIARKLEGAPQEEQVRLLLASDTLAAMMVADKRHGAVRSRAFAVDADRTAASFASWYEIFPRSMSDDVTRHGTFADVTRHLPRIRDMGFDVLYFPPIHPIGTTNRKGRNNAVTAEPGEIGSPYAIGSAEGGHEAIHPDLGTFEDFEAMRVAAAAHGLEIAIDFAIQCSPDHPWLTQHHGWFAWRPDGSMKYAENPPKKYQDIVNVDFYGPDAVPGLWVALAEIVMGWAERGVRIFRVDNPHTKPFPFWQWMIGEVRARFPDAVFLAEAFTRPKIMGRLGKLGFTQSYTYFTWRNTRREIEQYLTELTTTDFRDFFRPNFFVNTPDINPVFLQTSGRPGHLIRAVLAATLSGSWGVYSGFELCEATPLPGREEYLDSEKYQLRAWDWQRPGNIVAEITWLNRLRRQNPALQTHLGVTFLPSDNEQVIFFEKATAERDNVVYVAVSFDPFQQQASNVEIPLYRHDLHDGAFLATDDLVGGAPAGWAGKYQRIVLDPSRPYAIWRARP